MRKITLINISIPYDEHGTYIKFLPIEALKICSCLERGGYIVDFRDYQQALNVVNPFHKQSILDFFGNSENILAITFTSEAAPFALLLLKSLKDIFPQKRLIIGGFGVNGAEKEIINTLSYIDAVVYANICNAFLEAAELYDGIRESASYCIYRLGEKIFDKKKETLKNERAILPAYHKVDLSEYQEILMQTSTGCPYQCSFCQRRGKLIQFDLDQIINEVKYLRIDKGQKKFFFYDQTFITNKKRVMEFCVKLGEAGINDIEWACTGRVNLADEELFAKMKQSGCYMIYFGVESASNQVLKRIKKNITIEQVKKANEIAKKYFSVNNFIIWGFPDETIDEFWKTIEFVKEIENQGIFSIVYLCSLFPSTELYKANRNKISFSEECWDFNWSLKYQNLEVSNMVKQYIIKYPNIFSGFYIADPLIKEKLKIIKREKIFSHYPDV